MQLCNYDVAFQLNHMPGAYWLLGDSYSIKNTITFSTHFSSPHYYFVVIIFSHFTHLLCIGTSFTWFSPVSINVRVCLAARKLPDGGGDDRARSCGGRPGTTAAKLRRGGARAPGLRRELLQEGGSYLPARQHHQPVAEWDVSAYYLSFKRNWKRKTLLPFYLESRLQSQCITLDIELSQVTRPCLFNNYCKTFYFCPLCLCTCSTLFSR